MNHHVLPTRASKRRTLSTLVALGLGLVALGCEAPTPSDLDELDTPELADTITLGGPGAPNTKSSAASSTFRSRSGQVHLGDG